MKFIWWTFLFVVAATATIFSLLPKKVKTQNHDLPSYSCFDVVYGFSEWPVDLQKNFDEWSLTCAIDGEVK